MNEDRRKHPRVDLPSKIRYAIPAPFAVNARSGGVDYETFARDISAAGMGVDAFVSIPEGSEVVLSFSLLGRKVEIKGDLRYQRMSEGGRYRWGVCFTGGTDEARDIIGRYILSELAPLSRGTRLHPPKEA